MRRQNTDTTPVVLDMKGPEDLHVINTISDAIRVNDGQTSRSLARAEGVWAALRDAGFEIVLRDERPKPVMELEAGNVIELPPGTEIRSANPAAQEPDNWGLPERCADDLAERYGCRVAIVGLDDARLPLSDEDSDKPHAVVTERATGRVVGLVEAWISDDGDAIVPRTWLEIVLSAWSAARDPQRAA